MPELNKHPDSPGTATVILGVYPNTVRLTLFKDCGAYGQRVVFQDALTHSLARDLHDAGFVEVSAEELEQAGFDVHEIDNGRLRGEYLWMVRDGVTEGKT